MKKWDFMLSLFIIFVFWFIVLAKAFGESNCIWHGCNEMHKCKYLMTGMPSYEERAKWDRLFAYISYDCNSMKEKDFDYNAHAIKMRKTTIKPIKKKGK